MYRKNVIEMKTGFRELSLCEIVSVSGGNIVVTASNINSITPEDLALVGETLGSHQIIVTGNLGDTFEQAPVDDGFQNVSLIPILPTFEQLQEALRVIAEAILNALGYDVIDLEDQATLNQELNGKDQAFTIPADGDSPRVTFTRDGTAFPSAMPSMTLVTGPGGGCFE